MKVLAIDPGPHTGMATRLPNGDVIASMFQEPDQKYKVLEMIDNYKPDVVVTELFATSGRISRDGLRTVEIVGMIEGLCWKLGIEFVRMSPSSRRAFLSDAKKVRVTQGPHELDALAHLLSYEHRLAKGYLKTK